MQELTFGHVSPTALGADWASCQHNCSLIRKRASRLESHSSLGLSPSVAQRRCLQWRQMLCQAVAYMTQFFWQLTGC